MRGNSHMAMGVATGVIVSDTVFLAMKYESTPSFLKNCAEAVFNFLIPADAGVLPIYLFVPVAILLYLLGTLFPDIDTPYSTLGKIIHLPIGHRTWTHAIWLPLALCIGGIWYRLLFWFGLGMFVHDFCDSFSASGLHWFYPIKIKDNPHIKLYHTSQPSEYITVGVTWTVTVIYTIIVLQIIYQFFNFSVSF